jgi:hypothetical protein
MQMFLRTGFLHLKKKKKKKRWGRGVTDPCSMTIFRSAAHPLSKTGPEAVMHFKQSTAQIIFKKTKGHMV